MEGDSQVEAARILTPWRRRGFQALVSVLLELRGRGQGQHPMGQHDPSKGPGPQWGWGTEVPHQVGVRPPLEFLAIHLPLCSPPDPRSIVYDGKMDIWLGVSHGCSILAPTS